MVGKVEDVGALMVYSPSFGSRGNDRRLSGCKIIRDAN